MHIKMGLKKDYCSYSPEKILGIYIGDACLLHDIAYYTGGNKLNRKEADIQLRENIKAKGKRLFLIAWMYYFAVRLFGRNAYGYK